MSEEITCSCLLLPCSAGEMWAVPKTCLAEIITLYGVEEKPPSQIRWRGQDVPVLDMDEAGDARWRDPRAKTGLVAVLLGIEGTGCDYLGIPLRGLGLDLQDIPESEVEDCPERALSHSAGAFIWRKVTYQVPDLPGILARISSRGTFAGLLQGA